jgi:hypothetical protein
MLGVVQNQDSYAQAWPRSVRSSITSPASRIARSIIRALTGRRYARAMGYRLDDAEWVIVGQGSVVSNAERWPIICAPRADWRSGAQRHDVPSFPADVIVGHSPAKDVVDND